MRPHRQQPTRLPCPWDSPGKITGVGCHFLLQCMKVKSDSEVVQSCLTLSDPMECRPTRLLHPWAFPGKNIGVGCHFLLSEETKLEKDTCIPLFIATLFTIARPWKQPGCPSTDEWIKKLWYIYTMEYYSAVKRNAFESVLMRWMNLKPTVQSEVSQKEKDKYHILTHIYGI